MPPILLAEIRLAYSRAAALAAIAHGEQYQWANAALDQAGFTKRDGGSDSMPGPDVRPALPGGPAPLKPARRTTTHPPSLAADQ
ncbi:hypothetical protein M2158_007918 [Streptomyces sp. SAI-144]|uniref:hypothetical protein n=1 Tax=Streptomyces sp. SAI-144 TaxID=2940544 RepID=UPI002476FFB8|nr:hypothetical protein [Streptomyces sp. SAI-144]MDH6439377.1 hypothetical protein [Streptomyces sp. SAI-144]